MKNYGERRRREGWNVRSTIIYERAECVRKLLYLLVCHADNKLLKRLIEEIYDTSYLLTCCRLFRRSVRHDDDDDDNR